ncbi:MAG: co-chaperone GroES, partial [Gemmatimonadota bacterium]|nr:co-chaperone GroES [Gemmatimonadota bacterium]
MATKTQSSTKVAPLADRVMIKALEETEQMRGGLFIPDTAKEKPQQGEIIAVGPGRYEKNVRVPMEL